MATSQEVIKPSSDDDEKMSEDSNQDDETTTMTHQEAMQRFRDGLAEIIIVSSHRH